MVQGQKLGPNTPRRYRMRPEDLQRLGAIQVATRSRNDADALRLAINVAHGQLCGNVKTPAPVEVVKEPEPQPGGHSAPAPQREPVEPCPRCGRSLPIRAHSIPHHPTGRSQDTGLERCPGVVA